jgi:hypothetical protein
MTANAASARSLTRTPFIEYQLPLRPGVRTHLTLPEDFTTTEAKRVARFVEASHSPTNHPSDEKWVQP